MPLTLFEDVTRKLTEVEKKCIVPILLETILSKRTAKNAVTNKNLVKYFAECGFKTSEPRIRLMVNYIRNQQLIKDYVLMGTSNGYYVTDNIGEIDMQIESLESRGRWNLITADSIKAQKQHIISKHKKAS